MSGSMNYIFDVTQQVWVIATCGTSTLTVREGTVLRVRGTLVGSPASVASIDYDIQIVGDLGTTPFSEVDVFTDLASAMIEYQSRLTV